jgi:hypothetical protein
MLTNLRRELRLRLRQAAVLSAGLGIAVGAGLLTTAGPAGAATAGASHLAARTSLAGPGSPRCHLRIPRGRGTVRWTRCCPPRIQRAPGRQITVNCCPPQIRLSRPGRTVVVACCPAPMRVLWRHRGPVRVQCCPARIPPPARHCIVRIKPGGPGRRCPAPVLVRCKISIGQGS